MNKITDFAKLEFGELPGAFILDQHGAKRLRNVSLTRKYLEKQINGKLERINYIHDDNYVCYVTQESVIKGLPFNFPTFVLTGYDFYGKTLFLKKERDKRWINT